MSGSLKIGAISGLVAGIVSGIVVIVAYVIQSMGFNLGLGWGLPPVPISLIASLEIVHGLIFGIILGIIYCKIYGVIPGKGILKALLFSLFLYFMFNLRFAAITEAYAARAFTITHISWGIFIWLPFGIVLGISYEFLRNRYYVSKEEPKIIEYSMMSGLLPSAIAALIGGMATFVTIFLGVRIGFWEWIPGQLTDIEFLVSQFGAQTFFHFVWCTIFGLVFTKVYNLIPARGVIKGLVYGLIGLLITEGRMTGNTIAAASYYDAQGLHELAHGLFFWAEQAILLGLTVWIVFGIVLGLLYGKPSDES